MSESPRSAGAGNAAGAGGTAGAASTGNAAGAGGAARAASPPRAEPMLDVVKSFAFPRFAGGEGERRAGDMVEGELRRVGLDVSREAFTTSRSAVFRLRLLLQGVVAIAVVGLAAAARTDPRAGALFGLVLLLFMAGAGKWRRGLEPAFDLGAMISSENIVGRRAQTGANPLRVVILAHRDTKSSALPTIVPAVVVVLTLVFVAVVTVAAISAWVAGDPGLRHEALLPAAFVIAALLVAVAFNRSGDQSVGAMDNASGLAVLLHAARELPARDEFRDVDFTFLCTGAEEIGLAGALRWIQRHDPELDRARTVFVNIDSVGVGRTLLGVDVRGLALGGRAMTSVVREAGRASGVRFRLLSFLPGAGVDTMPVGARGLATVTVLGQVLGGPARRIHTRHDTLDHLNEEGLRDAATLVEEVVRQVARG